MHNACHENKEKEGNFKALNKYKNGISSWTGKLNIVKMAILAQLIYRFNMISIKVSGVLLLVCLFAEVNTLIQKFIWKCKDLEKLNNLKKD